MPHVSLILRFKMEGREIAEGYDALTTGSVDMRVQFRFGRAPRL
jgi:hypothetical protein